MSATLSLNDLVVQFDDTEVLRGVTLSVEGGTFGAVLGPSGCGKTTLLRTIAGLERPTSGEMRLGTQMLSTHSISLAPEKRQVGWVPQDSALFPHLTVAENVAFGLARSSRGVKVQAKSDRVAELLTLVSLGPLARRMPHQLSGGQAQRVALARALANNPAVVLLDEPFAGLDPVLRSELRVEVKNILSRAGATTLLVTHDQEEALSLADYIAVMREGVVEQAGMPAEIYAQPSTLWVASFLGDTNVVDGKLSGSLVATELGVLDIDEDSLPQKSGIVSVMVRPESLRLLRGTDYTVEAVHFAGHDALVTVRAPGRAPIRARVDSLHLPRVGDRVDVKVEGPALVYRKE